MAKETKATRPRRAIKEAVKICTGGCDHPKCGSGAIYGIGFLGAAFYYVSTATSFWGGALGLLKAVLWPAFLVYGLMTYLGM